jgi:hypothetical protein
MPALRLKRFLVLVVITAITGTALLLTLAGARADGPPGIPSSFYGVIEVNGAKVPTDTIITAWISGTNYVVGLIEDHGTFTSYSVDVPDDDLSTVHIKEGGVYSDVVQFRIKGISAAQTGRWVSGTNTRLDLTFLIKYTFLPVLRR